MAPFHLLSGGGRRKSSPCHFCGFKLMKKIVCVKCGNPNVVVAPEDIFLCDYCGAILIDLFNDGNVWQKPGQIVTDIGGS